MAQLSNLLVLLCLELMVCGVMVGTHMMNIKTAKKRRRKIKQCPKPSSPLVALGTIIVISFEIIEN